MQDGRGNERGSGFRNSSVTVDSSSNAHTYILGLIISASDPICSAGRPSGRCSLAPISSRTQARVLSPFFSARKESESGCLPLFLLPPSLPPASCSPTPSSPPLCVSLRRKNNAVHFGFLISFPPLFLRHRESVSETAAIHCRSSRSRSRPNRPPLRPH